MKLFPLLIAASVLCGAAQAAQAGAPQASRDLNLDLDLNISYYSRVLTPEGVTRESRYEETMLRRPGHVWTERLLPKPAQAQADHGNQKVALKEEHKHKEFNYIVLARHVTLARDKLDVTFIDAHQKQVIAIPPSEYDNVNFDGSWDGTFFLLNPKQVLAMPLSKQVSNVAGARWRAVEKNGVFQRILWDEQKQIPLIIESGDKANNFYRKVEVTVQTTTGRAPPWANLKGYGQREYSDFLD